GPNPDTAMILAKESIALAEKIDWQMGIGVSNNLVGWIYYRRDDYPNSLIFYKRSLEIWDALEKKLEGKDRIGILIRKAKALNSIGISYHREGQFPNALNYYLSA